MNFSIMGNLEVEYSHGGVVLARLHYDNCCDLTLQGDKREMVSLTKNNLVGRAVGSHSAERR